MPFTFSFKSYSVAAATGLLVAGCATKAPAPVVDRSPPRAPPPVVQQLPAAPEAAPAAPAVAAKPADTGPTHTVQRGETLVGIALAYGLNFRDLVAWNELANPNKLEVGQVLRLTAPGSQPPPDLRASGAVTQPVIIPGAIEAKPIGPTTALATPGAAASTTTPGAAVKTEPRATKVPYSDKAFVDMSMPDRTAAPAGSTSPAVVPPVAQTPPTTSAPPSAAAPPPAPPAETKAETRAAEADAVNWAWPAKGRVKPNPADLDRGVDIFGKKGDPVLAAADGKVMYVGTGVRGYGQLVIVKHNESYVSAYAHNDQVLVKEGDQVKKGQRIARMGDQDASDVKLRFIIRQKGKAVDPTTYLPKT